MPLFGVKYVNRYQVNSQTPKLKMKRKRQEEKESAPEFWMSWPGLNLLRKEINLQACGKTSTQDAAIEIKIFRWTVLLVSQVRALSTANRIHDTSRKNVLGVRVGMDIGEDNGDKFLQKFPSLFGFVSLDLLTKHSTNAQPTLTGTPVAYYNSFSQTLEIKCLGTTMKRNCINFKT